ncbi:MAG: CARDB domain-containing protein [Phototrophicaceae bacterium]|jgi:hypothetical protein
MKIRWLLLWILAFSSLPLLAQPTAATNAISFPPPVYVVRGTLTITGSAVAPYYFQVQPLGGDLAPVGSPSPISLIATTPVQDSTLLVWESAAISDGVYALEMIVNAQTPPQIVSVSPIRVENTPSRFSPTQAPIANTTLIPTPQIILTARPVIAPTIAPQAVSARSLIQANVRLGDSASYPGVAVLDVGQTATVIGRSSRSAWLQVSLASGQVGFIAPELVALNGEISGLPFVEPPPLPYTRTPLPTATPLATATPITRANLRVVALRTDPSPPICNQTFSLYVTVQNDSPERTRSSGVMTVIDRHRNSGTVAANTVGGFPALDPYTTFEMRIPLTVGIYYDETHRLEMFLDANNEVPEVNEGDNGFVQDYTLQRGGC